LDNTENLAKAELGRLRRCNTLWCRYEARWPFFWWAMRSLTSLRTKRISGS